MEDRLIEQGLKSKAKKEQMLKSMVPSFKPDLNKQSVVLVKEKGHIKNNLSVISGASKLRNSSNDDLERELVR